MPADQSAPKRMLPEHNWVQSRAVLGSHVEHAARHRNIADALKSEADYGPSQGIHFLPPTKQGTICHLQTLRSERLILRNHVCDFLHVELFHGLFEVTQAVVPEPLEWWESGSVPRFARAS